MHATGPSRIIAVRHGESEANLAYREAGDEPLVYGRGDDEVTLTPLGREQAASLGALLAALPEEEAPDLVRCSPFRRALDTWAIARQVWGADPPMTVDERLRDRGRGELGRYNEAAIALRRPEELARLRAEGEYRYRPPGGESFGDVAARVRDFLAGLRGRADGRRVLIVAHDAVVLALRHVIAEAPDADLAELDAFTPIRNGSVSTWHTVGGRLTLLDFNAGGHL
ncbi:histidine phosphatase family protein [Nonomuraea sp. NPDC049725]|uniref:histidine phosphatase family protein n=1 Tax=Nonomuraea sp. NPDC049725 TaxID=3154508 RepID=UPI00341FA690